MLQCCDICVIIDIFLPACLYFICCFSVFIRVNYCFGGICSAVVWGGSTFVSNSIHHKKK